MISDILNVIKMVFQIKKIIIERKEKKEKEKPQILMQLNSQSISPVSANLYLEIENKSSFDVYNIRINDFIEDDFFKVPPLYSNDTIDTAHLKNLIYKSLDLYREIEFIYKLKEKGKKDFLYCEGYISPYIYLLNIYQDLINMHYYDTIKYFSNDPNNIEKKIETIQDVIDFIGFVQYLDSNLTAIRNNIEKYMREISKKKFYVYNIKAGEQKKINIIDFHFFIFKFYEKDISEIEFSSKKIIYVDYDFEKYEKGKLIKKEYKNKEIKINPTLIKNDFKDELNELFESSYYKEWESSLSENHLKKFREIKLKAIDDIYIYIRVYNITYLGTDFFNEYRKFIKILDSKFKIQQLVIG